MWAKGSDHESGLDSVAVANFLYSTAFASIESSMQYVDSDTGAFRNIFNKLGGMQVASRSTAMDPRGNAKFPNPRLLSDYNFTDTEKWVDVPKGDVTDYVSLIGVPVSGLPITSKENLTVILSAPVEILRVS